MFTLFFLPLTILIDLRSSIEIVKNIKMHYSIQLLCRSIQNAKYIVKIVNKLIKNNNRKLKTIKNNNNVITIIFIEF